MTRRLLARALDALHSRVEAIKDKWDAMFDVFPEGDSLDSHITYADDLEEGR